MFVPPSSLNQSVVQSNLIDEISTYSPNDRMSLVIQGLVGLAIVIILATIWFVWVTRKSKRVRDDEMLGDSSSDLRGSDPTPVSEPMIETPTPTGQSTFVTTIPTYSQPDLPDFQNGEDDYDISDAAKSSQPVHRDDSVD